MPDKKSSTTTTKTPSKPPARAQAAKKAAGGRRDRPAPGGKKDARPTRPQPKAAPKTAAKAQKPAAKAAKPAPKPQPPAKPQPAPKQAKKPAPAKAPAVKAPPPKPEAAAKPAPEKPAKVAKAPPAAKPGPVETKSAPSKPAAPAKAAAVKAAKPAPAPKPPKPAPVSKIGPAAMPNVVPVNQRPIAAGVKPLPAPKPAPAPVAAPKPVAPQAPELVGESQPVPAFKGKTGSGPNSKTLVLVGAIAGAFGVKGEVRLRAFTAQREGVISYGPLYDQDGKILLRPKTWRELKDGVAVVAPEIKTREQAEKLRGVKLFVPRAHLPATAEDEFYIVDLLGCRAEALDGASMGEVVAVWNFGAGDLLELKPPNGGPNLRLSFTKQNVPMVDLAGRRIVVDPPPPEPPAGK